MDMSDINDMEWWINDEMICMLVGPQRCLTQQNSKNPNALKNLGETSIYENNSWKN